MSTADQRREQARGNGVAQAGQFGHQQHSEPGAFDAGSETPSMADVPTPKVWVGFTHYNARGTVVGYSDDERVDPAAARQVLDSWSISEVEELLSNDPVEAFEEFASELVAQGAVSKGSALTSASATPDSAELTTYLAARRADEERRGPDVVQAERAAASIERASRDLAKRADRYQVEVASTAAFIARQAHPDAKEVLVGTNDMTGEYALIGVRNRDGTVTTDRVDGDRQLEAALQEMPWENPQWLDYIDEDGDDNALRDDHSAAYLLDISRTNIDTHVRAYQMDNPSIPIDPAASSNRTDTSA